MIRHFILTFTLLTLFGCASSPEPQLTKEEIRIQHPQLSTSDAYQDYFQEWQGVPYKYGGTTKRGVDCSAFTQDALYNLHQLSLPRTTQYQVVIGQLIPLENAQKGDLIFFKTSVKVRHVGLYIGNREFMHASTSKGVIISSLDNPYWKKAFWQVRRVL
ncbi:MULTISPECIES: C40 family peptidase [Aliivibrio]|uniref:Hydrolase n=1 Tax=Aliivibrio finisterrensis TaxID=511998 RepID=A0A4Q5KXK8_9GAMM|nr:MULTISPECIES: NlpC/P60 family protein [Aliivibrio]MDD9177641.1 NlpC/P60 family protein [Aliivibrio sp. A6]RYU51252.1 hydrolase [Aliivibrio finisterrensis]RYU54449.1 hydrolase [Aliivibrio finisterrensis]RYU59517.1 hydrolase [Aliivibrio finisterrensis]RYU65468.1 hydrolase [Aliivibrio finisterrensis]